MPRSNPALRKKQATLAQMFREWEKTVSGKKPLGTTHLLKGIKKFIDRQLSNGISLQKLGLKDEQRDFYKDKVELFKSTATVAEKKADEKKKGAARKHVQRNQPLNPSRNMASIKRKQVKCIKIAA